ncbi:deazapurine DNA modification protein DpdA family protein [Salinispora arenicola]|uniref:deazapurine DNA modification protein DpdA family protein n=1 Tax=Salinispora arenicola TaxID=168697 RepID=UPI00207A3A67|nr:hypothetical protein [Salinispora arenicola]MCN0152282.1 hypothetical protein [Salinispora arenicola]
MNGPAFFLGTHQPGWLGKAGVPLFVSDRRLRPYKTLPRAAAPWACDSGGFTELQKYGRWTVSPIEYVARLHRYRDETGHLLWAAPQDWMCEPIVINGGTVGGQHFAGTHLSVTEHQRRTVANYAQLRDLAPDLPIIPVVQGWNTDDYLRCVDLYWSMIRLDLTTMPLVGLGSVCRRQGTHHAGHILRALHLRGLHRLHGFGFKTLGLAEHGHLLASADSLAWSVDARRSPPLPGHHTQHRNCANCLTYALQWRTNVLAAAAPRAKPALDDLEAAA